VASPGHQQGAQVAGGGAHPVLVAAGPGRLDGLV
jgi:hypothetical protein